MGLFSNVDEAREYFKGDKFAGMAGVVIDAIAEEEVTCSMVLSDVHKNANGGIMGGAIFTLADLAFAVLSNQRHMPTVAQQVSVNYLSAPKGEKLSFLFIQPKHISSRESVLNIWIMI